MNDRPILSRPVDVASVPASGLTRDVVATAAERSEVARAYGFLDVPSLRAELTATADGAGVISVDGRVRAEVVQSCVVSLAPVEQTIDEPVAARYALSRSRAAPRPLKPGAEVMLDPHADEAPEPLDTPVLDLGAVTLEHFLLAVDPYPRAEGATVPAEFAGEESRSGDSPFAALGRLRDRGASDA